MLERAKRTALTLGVAALAGCVSSTGGMGGGGSSDATVSGTRYNATGQIGCARAGQTMRRCDFGVIREGNGNGRIVVTWPNGEERVIGFEMGTPAWTEPGGDMTVDRNADLYLLTVGNERFEVPEAVITGG